MRKLFSLMMMFAAITLVFAEDPVTIASGTFDGKNASYTEGWSTSGTGKGRTDCIIIGAGENITSPEVDLSQYESITINIKARRYGTLSGSKAEIAVSFDGEDIGSTTASGTTATTSLTAINYTVSDLSTGNFVITCSNATSAGSTHGAGINSIVITGVKKASSTPDPTSQTLYLKLSADWAGYPAKYAVYYFNDTENGWSEFMTEVEGDANVYTTTIPVGYSNVISARINGSATAPNWSDKWSQTKDLTIPTDDKDLFTITSAGTGDDATGEWSKYVAPVPVENVTIYYVNTGEWKNVNAFVWPNEGNAYKEWSGEAMTKTENKVNGYDVYSYTFPENYVNIIFNDGTDQTSDLVWDKTKPYYCDGKWYAAVADIPSPAVPLEGNIWKAVSTTQVVAGSHFIDEALLKMDGVYATTLKANTRTIAGEEFTHAIQVRAKAYPSATDVIGAENEGSTPLVITAKENVEVTFYYNRQVVDEGGTENDNKDIIVVDQADPGTKLEGDFVIDQILEGNKYLNATKKLTLEKGHVYTATAAGTTIQLHGVKMEAPEPTLPKVGLGANFNEWKWGDNLFTPAEDKQSASFKVELGVTDTIEFKIVSDNGWLSLNGEGESLYGLHRGWTKAEHVNLIDNGRNFSLVTDAEGEYVFTWTYADSTLTITFPAMPDVAIKLVPGAWNTGETKFAAVTWKKGESMSANGVITDWFVGTDTVVGMIPADADSIAFASFSKELSAPALDNSIIIAHSDMLEIDKVSMLYTITTQGEEIWFGYWGAAPAAAEWFLVGDMTEWETGKISFKDAEIKVNLTEVGKDYGFKVLKIVGEEKIWYGNSGTMSRENHTAWKFDSEEKSNCMFNADIAGEYIFSFQLDKDGEPMITLTYPEKPITPSEHVYSVVGPLMPDGWSEKSTASEMTLAEGVYSYTLTDVELAQGVDYEYKIVEDHSWDVSFPQEGNASFNVEKSGKYDVTFTLNAETKAYAAIPTLKEEVVVVPTVQLAGDWTNWEKAPVTMTLDESKQFASLTVNLTKGNHEFKVIVAGNWKTKANGGKSYELKREWTGVAGVTDDASENLLLSADTDGEYTFTWTFANDSLGVTFPEKTDVPDRLEEGYYLIGLHGWTVDDIQTTDKFTVNSTDENEFLLENVSLKKDDKFKAVYVQNDAIKTWFPDGDNNDYVVDADHVGTKTIYFRPKYSDEWGGHFYVAPNGGTGMENVNADVKAVKVLRNGQLFIIRGEHTYTPAGQMVK